MGFELGLLLSCCGFCCLDVACCQVVTFAGFRNLLCCGFYCCVVACCVVVFAVCCSWFVVLWLVVKFCPLLLSCS